MAFAVRNRDPGSRGAGGSIDGALYEQRLGDTWQRRPGIRMGVDCDIPGRSGESRRRDDLTGGNDTNPINNDPGRSLLLAGACVPAGRMEPTRCSARSIQQIESRERDLVAAFCSALSSGRSRSAPSGRPGRSVIRSPRAGLRRQAEIRQPDDLTHTLTNLVGRFRFPLMKFGVRRLIPWRRCSKR